MSSIDTILTRLRLLAYSTRAERLRQRAMRRPFSTNAKARLLLVSQPGRIPQSQIFPFHHYSRDLMRLYGAEVREADLEHVLAGGATPLDATIVAFQTPFDISDDDLQRLIARLNAAYPDARLGCLDWFAPTDLRNAARIDPLVDFYVKKHVLRDRNQYGKPTLGDTNLSDYYSRRFDIPEREQCFTIPPGFMNKLIVGPSFATGPLILPFLTGKMPSGKHRPIDMHARFAVKGSPWYQSMRGEAAAALERLADLSIPQAQNVKLARFMAELRKSKICFSPFGYGEVCWRDYEAVMTGAVMLKPDMSHVETNPNIFIPWETYVPVAWDMSDLEQITRKLLADEKLRQRIAHKAFHVLKDWLESDAFARNMAPMFA